MHPLAVFARADEAAKRQLCAELEQRIELPGMLWVMPSDEAASKEHLARVAGQPIFVRE